MIETIAQRIAIYIKSLDPDHTASLDVLRYGLIICLNFLSTLLFTLAIGMVLGETTDVIYGMIAFMVLRAFSGGFHFKSSILCTISTALIVVAAAISTLPANWSIILTGISSILVLLYAPSRIERQSNIPRRFYPYLKLISFGIVAFNFLIQSDVLAMIFFIQSVTLILPYERRWAN